MFASKTFSSTKPRIPPTKTTRVTRHLPPFSVLLGLYLLVASLPGDVFPALMYFLVASSLHLPLAALAPQNLSSVDDLHLFDTGAFLRHR